MDSGNSTRLPVKAKDITGVRFGRLVAMRYAGQSRFRAAMWECQCDCGKQATVSGNALRSGNTRSCGCLAVDVFVAGIKDRSRCDGADLPEYHIWHNMVRRCTCPKSKDYHRYGGRGIRVCERWLDSCRLFVEDVGTRPSLQHQIDRYPNNDGNYELGNVRWALPRQNCQNRRDNVLLEWNGRTLCVTEWARETGINCRTIMERLRRGWTTEKALSTPTITKHRRVEVNGDR